MRTFKETYESTTGHPPPPHFLPVQQRLFSGVGGARIVVVTPPRFATSTWLHALVGFWLAAREGEFAFYSTSYCSARSSAHGSVVEQARVTALTRLGRQRIGEFGTAAEGTYSEQQLRTSFIATQPPSYHFLAIDNPLPKDMSPQDVARASAWVKQAAAQVLPGGDALLCVRGRQDVAGGDLVDFLGAEGWEIHTVRALTGEAATFPAVWPLELLAKARAELGEQAFLRLFLAEPAPARLTSDQVLQRIRSLASQEYASPDAQRLAALLREALGVMQEEPAPPELVLTGGHREP